jgi:hypothetical protein
MESQADIQKEKIMSRLFTALTAAALIGAAAPAAALSFQVNFPTLTYPTQTTPDVGQACTDLTTMTGDTCEATDK